MLEKELATLENARPEPRVRPSSLPFFQQEWRDARQRVFRMDNTIGPLELFPRLARFMHWTKDDKEQHRLELGQELANYIDVEHGTVEGLRDILRQYNERKGKIRWLEEDIAAMSSTACKRLINKQIHVNINDYTSGSDRQFDSYQHLKAHTLRNNRFFPLEAAKANGLTAILLKNFSGKKGRGGEVELSALMGDLVV